MHQGRIEFPAQVQDTTMWIYNTIHRKIRRPQNLPLQIQIGSLKMSIDHQEPITTTTSDSSIQKSKGITQTLVLSILASISILIGIVLYYLPVTQALQVNSYQSASCTILAKKLETVTTNGGDDVYNPSFTFNVPTADGQTYIAHGYGLIDSSSGNRQAEQALLDSYKLNSHYPCWYEASNPTHAVLNRNLDLMAFAPGTIFTLGGLILLFIALASRPNPVKTIINETSPGQ